MRCSVVRIAAVIALLGVTAGTAWAFPPANPYSPSIAELQGQIDRTGDFSGGTQASTGVKTVAPNGVWWDITWRSGASFTNEDFTRFVPTIQFPDTGGGQRKNLGNYDGIKWCVTVEGEPISVKPYTQVGPDWVFYEGTQPGTPPAVGTGTFGLPGDSSMQMVLIDWNMVNSGGSIPLAGRSNVYETGFQVYGPVIPQDSGIELHSRVCITQWVPEPASFALAGLGLALIGMFGRGRRN